MSISRILISRTDGIGDVVLTLPLAGVLKDIYPDCIIVFLGKKYTKAVIECCENVDIFLDWDLLGEKPVEQQVELIKSLNIEVIVHVFPSKEISILGKKAGIPIRIGTTNRLYHWFNCNKLVYLSRKRSSYHEAQLNLKLITCLGAEKNYDLKLLPNYFSLTKINPLREEIKEKISKDLFNLIIHPCTKGSAREWGVENFSNLIEILPSDKFNLFITGTKEEGEKIKEKLLDKFPFITDLTGKLNLEELISFISSADGIVSSSTGPLHVGAALGKHAIGIYAPMVPIHPVRWTPIGKKSSYLSLKKKCSFCRKSLECKCIKEIKPEQVKGKLLNCLSIKSS